MIQCILVSGANGFVGNAVCKQAVDYGIRVKGATRGRVEVPSCIESFVVGEIHGSTVWTDVLRDDRVGRNNVIFKMPKFRSMRMGTPAVATHLLVDASSHLTPIGSFLRKSSLDELPQLWSILAGDMSFVGPRPALFNQLDLITLRTKQGVHTLVPGLTGWAQVNGRDELPISEKVKLDAVYLQRQSLWFDVRILWMTFVKVLKRDGVSH
jgi:O-antigen biosynthesis protein WbqP